MSEESNVKAVEGNNETNPTSEGSKNNDAIPYSRFQEVVSEKNSLKDQVSQMQERLNEIDASNKAKREERMKKNEEYTTLLAEKDAEIEKYKGTADKWNDYETTRRESLVNRLPDNKQKFVSSMSLSDLEEFVDIETSNLNKGTGIDASRVGAKPQDSGEFGGYSSMSEFAMRDPKGCEAYLEANTKGYIK
mgnify:FL=1